MSVKIALSSDTLFWIFWPILTDFTIISLCSWQDSCARGTFLADRDGKSRLLHFLLYELCMTPTFVHLVETIWLPNHEEWCNTKLTCKRARPSVTIKSWTQKHVASYSGTRQGILLLLQTWETKTFIKQSFISHNKKLYASKEVKEFPKLLQRSHSVRDKNHRKSTLECMQETHRPHDLSICKDNICSVKTKNPPHHIPYVFLRCQF